MTNERVPLQALIFDYGGVLMRTADPTARRALEQRFGLSRGEADDLVFRSPRWDDVQHGRIDSDGFWSHVGQQLDVNAEELAAFRRGFWSGDRLDERLAAFIRRMRGDGYRTGLLSNAPATLRGYLEELGIADAFDVIVISGEERVVKPDPEIYQRVLKRLEVEAQEAFFVDDVRANVEAARRVGLRAVRFRGLAPLRVRLRDLGVRLPDADPAPLPDVQAIIFDWGGVMEELPQESDVAEWERRLALAPGVLPRVLWGETWRKLEVGAISGDEYAQHIADRLGLPDQEAGLLFLQEFYASDRLNRDVLAAVRALRDRYQVALLTNAFPRQAEVIGENHGIDVRAEFDVYVNSATVGLSKPNPDIYRLTLERLGVEPEQAVFLDDGLRNVDSAREIGLHALQFVNPATSLRELEALLGHPLE